MADAARCGPEYSSKILKVQMLPPAGTFGNLAKNAVIRLAWAQAQELREHGAAAVALTPGWLRSEQMLEHHGVTEANWRECVRKTIDLSPDSVTVYEMEIPFNTTIYKQMKAEGKLVAPVV